MDYKEFNKLNNAYHVSISGHSSLPQKKKKNRKEKKKKKNPVHNQ